MEEAPGFFSVASFVRAALPAPPARVLEVGAGSGELAATLWAAGYEVVAIDPASESPVVRAAALLELDEPAGSFDAAVAVVSLHHVEPLEGSLRHLADLVRPDGVLVVDEFDVDRFDERAARWLIDAREDHEHHTDPEALSASCDSTCTGSTASGRRSTRGSRSPGRSAARTSTAGTCPLGSASPRSSSSRRERSRRPAPDWSGGAAGQSENDVPNRKEIGMRHQLMFTHTVSPHDFEDMRLGENVEPRHPGARRRREDEA